MTVDLLTAFTKVELEVESETPKGGIGLFWGTFNPVHLAHLVIADQVRQALKLDEVRFLPENPSSEVLEMLKLATEDEKFLSVEEARCETNFGIFETLEIFKKKFPTKELYFILGADMIASLSRWPDIEKMFELATFVGIQRPKYRAGTSNPILWVDCPQMDISSSQIRKQIEKGLEPRFLLPAKVLTYIQKRRLYQVND